VRCSFWVAGCEWPWPKTGRKTEGLRVRQGRQSSSSCWQLNRSAVLVKAWMFVAWSRPPKPGSLLTCYPEVQAHSPHHWRWFQSQCIGGSWCQGASVRAVMLVAKDRVSYWSGCSQLTKPSNSLPTVAGRPCQGAVYGRR
jgi:hypothetical protein